jgi:flagellar basal body rod protein FlgG
MSTSSLPAIASSGLAANQARLEVAAHNIANANTANFRRQEVIQQARAEGGVDFTRRTEQAAQVEQAEQGRLEQDLVNQHVALYNFQANVLTSRAEGSMVGSLLDMSA